MTRAPLVNNEQTPSRVSILARLVPAISYAIPMLGAVLSSLLINRTLEAMRNVESVGIAAVEGGMAEANLPVLVALYLAIFLGLIGSGYGGSLVHIDDHGGSLRYFFPDLRRYYSDPHSTAVGSSIAFDPGYQSRQRWNRLRGIKDSNVLDAGNRYFSCVHFDPLGWFADPVAIRSASEEELGAVDCSGVDGVRADWDGDRFPGPNLMVQSSQIRGENPALADHCSIDEDSHSRNCASTCFRAESNWAR